MRIRTIEAKFTMIIEKNKKCESSLEFKNMDTLDDLVQFFTLAQDTLEVIATKIEKYQEIHGDVTGVRKMRKVPADDVLSLEVG